MTANRRDVLRASGIALAGATAATPTASAGHADRGAPEEVTLEYDEEIIKAYQPRLVLEGVNPRPVNFHALHARSTESTLNAVYGFALYSYQEGATSHDSHLGDHEPIIVWYDQESGDVVRVDYAAYHWFRGTAPAESLEFGDDAGKQPRFRVDPTYHHYYAYTGDVPGEQIETTSLLESIEPWLNNGLEESLAASQPYDPYAMLSRPTWWQHNAGNWLDASLKALWFNVGLSGASSTADVGEVRTW